MARVECECLSGRGSVPMGSGRGSDESVSGLGDNGVDAPMFLFRCLSNGFGVDEDMAPFEREWVCEVDTKESVLLKREEEVRGPESYASPTGGC